MQWKGPVANDLAENTTDTNWAQDAGAVTSVSEGDTEPVPTDTNDVPVNSEEDTQGARSCPSLSLELCMCCVLVV